MKSEKEKMLAGEIYDANNDVELITERDQCKALCYKHNHLHPSEKSERYKVIKELLGSCKSDFLIEQPFYCDYGYNIEIGDNFCSNYNLIILDEAKVCFGNNVFIAPNCSFFSLPPY